MSYPSKKIGSTEQENLAVGHNNLRPVDAAAYTGLSESTLAKLRMRHNRSKGPNFLKISACVIYRRTDLDAWMDQHVVEEVGNA